MKIFENDKIKILIHEDYNYIYNKSTGGFARWGKTKDDDPLFSPFGPEIADIEISTICSGIRGRTCDHCYKSNTYKGKNMSLDTFKKIFSKIKTSALTQVAFGIGDIDANKDMYSIFDHCRENGVTPNVTINGDRLTDYHVNNLASLCVAVAVSRYDDKDVCYNAVERLTMAGLSQVNIHCLVSSENYDRCIETIRDASTDDRLNGLKAVVFLSLKQVGRGKKYTSLGDVSKYKVLVDMSEKLGVGCGFDSCYAPVFLKAMEGHENYKMFEMLAEGCESSIFSIYCDVNGVTYPCSFLGGTEYGVDVLECNDFLNDVWFSEKIVKFRESLLRTADSKECLVKGCRQCPVYSIY